MAIRVLKPGLFTTIQDLGRPGYAHLGISPCGAADPLSLRIANRLAGNAEDTAALEMTLLGGTFEFEVDAVIALTGSLCDAQLGGLQAPANTAWKVTAGSVLQFGSMQTGARCYLAVQGGFDLPVIMGSASTDVRGGFGGLHGRRLQAGDLLPTRESGAGNTRVLRQGALERLAGEGPIRVTRGAQQDWFGPEAFETLNSCAYTISDLWDRAGLRLKGEALHSLEPSQLLTDGIPLGAIQVPRDGQPIILFVDQQTTGGYPKIASVIAADIHRVGQLRPRQEVRFREVTISQAVQALREQEGLLQEIFE